MLTTYGIILSSMVSAATWCESSSRTSSACSFDVDRCKPLIGIKMEEHKIKTKWNTHIDGSVAICES